MACNDIYAYNKNTNLILMKHLIKIEKIKKKLDNDQKRTNINQLLAILKDINN